MCHTQNAVALELQGSITDPVALKGRSGAMKVVPVELDRQAVIMPDHINLEARGERVDRRRRQLSITAQLEKPPLELGARWG